MDVTYESFTEEWPKPRRVMAPIVWYGGKGNLVKKLLPLLPPGRVYVEPYCGAASMFWNLEPKPVEVLNDLNKDIINLFRTLQDRSAFEELAHRLTFTPYSLEEFRRALATLRDENAGPVDRAWAFFTVHGQGYSGTAKTESNWSRVFVSAVSMAKTASRWRSSLRLLRWWHDRLMRVQLDCRDALTVIGYWDSPDTVFYVDPPYVAETRTKNYRKVYQYEADDEHHRKLVEVLLGLKGRALVSGYAHPIYEPLEAAGWRRYAFKTACHAAGRTRKSKLREKGAVMKNVPRTEVVWVSPDNETPECLWRVNNRKQHKETRNETTGQTRKTATSLLCADRLGHEADDRRPLAERGQTVHRPGDFRLAGGAHHRGDLATAAHRGGGTRQSGGRRAEQCLAPWTS